MKDVSLDVSHGVSHGVFGLVGPNGAGRSTLMRILATLQDADSGSASRGAPYPMVRDGHALEDALHDGGCRSDNTVRVAGPRSAP